MYQAIENAASHNGIFAAPERRQSHVDTPVFSLDLTISASRTRRLLWSLSGCLRLNTFRHKLIFSIQKFENFNCHKLTPSFWDKYEKSNWFLSKSLRLPTKNWPAARLASYPTHNKMATIDIVLLEKYVVSKSVYPDLSLSSSSRELNAILNKLLSAKMLKSCVISGFLGADQATVSAKKSSFDLLVKKSLISLPSLGLPPM